MLYIYFDIVLGRRTKLEGSINSPKQPVPSSYQEVIYSIKANIFHTLHSIICVQSLLA